MKEMRKQIVLAIVINRPVVFQVPEDWTSFRIVSVMLENWRVHSEGFSPLS